jgi:RHS repeat-associated protein
MPHSPADNHARLQQSRTVLLATDNKNSILAEVVEGEPDPIAYSAYGQQSAQHDVETNLGFNGELRETHLGWYLLGNGYRAYNPTLMRFHSPDSWSPFGGGGLNAYMYCVGDPVNFSDPTGHMKASKFFTGVLDFFFGGAERTGRKGIAYVPAGMGEMRPETGQGLSGFVESALVVGGAPGPRHGVPRQSSYNYGASES